MPTHQPSYLLSRIFFICAAAGLRRTFRTLILLVRPHLGLILVQINVYFRTRFLLAPYLHQCWLAYQVPGDNLGVASVVRHLPPLVFVGRVYHL
jgi:hypothetical protein